MKKAITIVLMLSLLLGSCLFAYGTEEDKKAGGTSDTSSTSDSNDDTYNGDELGLIGASAILIDADTGEILYEKNKDEQHYPASTTKMITAILALENLNLEENIPIDAETPFTEGSRIYLLEGETVSGKDVMYGMMLESANDAAIAFAKKISGTVGEFAKLMNEKARELGAKNTNFVNPNGLHDEKHVTTAYDLAMIARYCMRNKTFRDYVSTYYHLIPATNLQQERHLYNTNRLLYDEKTKVTVGGVERGCKYEGITGIKTGYTSNAQGCLVASAKRDGMELIAVILASTDKGRFQDCITLLDYGFANYKSVKVIDAGTDLGTVQVKRGSVNHVSAVTAASTNMILPVNVSEQDLRWETELYSSLRAPVDEGQKAGVLRVYQGDKLMGEFDAVTTAAVPEGGFFSILGIQDSTGKVIKNVLLGVLLFLLVLLTVYILLKRRQVKRKRKRREEKKRRRAELERRQVGPQQELHMDRRRQRRLDDPLGGKDFQSDNRSRREEFLRDSWDHRDR